MTQQLTLPFGPFRNRTLFSTHWLESRLPLEPEWTELREESETVAQRLGQLWVQQRSRVERYGSEQALEQGFIQPVFDALGWKLNYQTYLQGRRPDYALFTNDAALDAALAVDHQSHEFWEHATVVADAKAWGVSLDRPVSARGQKEFPPQQIEWYLDRSRRDFGILTNGRLWRLIPRLREPHQGRFDTYYEIDLPDFLERWTTRLEDLDDFLYFYLLFSPIAFREIEDRRPLVHRAVEGSSAFRLGIGDDLRERAFEAVRLATEGFLCFPDNGLDPEVDVDLCRRESFVLIYRLLFVMFAEDRGLLPYGTNRLYTENRSLRRHRDDIAHMLDNLRLGRGSEFSKESHSILDDLRALFDLVDRGHGRYDVPPYNGGLFDPEAHPFLEERNVSNWHLARAIDQLGRARDPGMSGDGLFRVDYRDLAIQHLGSIYEGLLELEPHHASVPMIVVSKHGRDRVEERIIPESHPVPQGFERTDLRYEVGQVYLQTNKGERRAYGSYYTPDNIVNHIVERTLGPLCEQISNQIDSEIEALDTGPDSEEAVRRLTMEFDDRILKVRVLDPAMGSGHFLLRACTYLAEEIATHPHTYDEAVEQLGTDESALIFWKRRVAENCLYGVDLNDLAVELAKLAMWLETVAVDQPLTFLNHHFRHGNSLIGARIANLDALPDSPSPASNLFAGEFQDKVSLLLEPVTAILSTPSATLDQVKQKQQLYRNLERVRTPFRQLADVWASTFALPEQQRVHIDDYRRLIDEIGRPRRFADAIESATFEEALAIAKQPYFTPFHWEIEFPEVFFDEEGQPRSAAGFDAIIGNPPYDVLSERESGHDLSALRSVVDFDSTYTPSVGGKNNLYKLFVCRALDLQAEGGFFGFITPMAILGDKITVGIRDALLKAGTFKSIEAFPQKDNPRNRVFPEAKLSTAVFIHERLNDATADNQPFRCQVHPGRDLNEVSAFLNMSREQVPTYDPINKTIISCAQADLDLATRLMNTGRLSRLRDVAEFSQGEVNETVQKRRGTASLEESMRFRKLVTRGAAICMYVVRPASQGNDLFLDIDAFLEGAGEDTKAFHHRHARVAVQESSPQNNFRRIIASRIPAGEFCNHKINYCPDSACRVDPRLLLAFLNSKLADWYFRLGSTNAAVSHYQLYNLPFPIFDSGGEVSSDVVNRDVVQALDAPDVEGALRVVEPLTTEPPFSMELFSIIGHAVDRIIEIEQGRGEISRSARSAVAPMAQPYQDFLDRLFYRLAGLSDDEWHGLETRLADML